MRTLGLVCPRCAKDLSVLGVLGVLVVLVVLAVAVIVEMGRRGRISGNDFYRVGYFRSEPGTDAPPILTLRVPPPAMNYLMPQSRIRDRKDQGFPPKDS